MARLHERSSNGADTLYIDKGRAAPFKLSQTAYLSAAPVGRITVGTIDGNIDGNIEEITMAIAKPIDEPTVKPTVKPIVGVIEAITVGVIWPPITRCA